MTLGTFIMYNYHHCLVPEYFYHPPKQLFHPVLQPLATTNLHSVSMEFPILDTSCQWNHTICGLLCLASFTQHDVFKVHLPCILCQRSAPLPGQIIFHDNGWTTFCLSIHPLIDTWCVCVWGGGSFHSLGVSFFFFFL